MSQAVPQTIYLNDYQPPAYLIEQADLTFQLNEEETRVRAVLKVKKNSLGPSVTDLRLDGEQLELLSIALDGVALTEDKYLTDDESLTVLDVPEQFTLETLVRVLPQENTALEGLYKSGTMFCTQCEAEGFRKITWYLDRPDVMARFTTTIEADQSRYPVLLSNGNPIDERKLENGRYQITWEDPFPKPAYLFALVAGDLRDVRDSFTTQSGREIDLRIYVEPENIDKCDHAMASLKRAMAWDEEHYGCEYDLDIYMIVAVNDFNMGAMENKGLNIFNSKYVLARPETATDTDFQGIEGVIAHEYFHNWTGNRITCRDWFQLSLKEGLTVFRDQEFSADMGSRGVKRIEDVRLLRAHQFAEDASPMAHPVRPSSYIEINNFYTVTVYEKGAEVVRMQSNLLGPECFRKATDLYFERHDGQAVTTEDFVQCMADASGRDLSQFKRWYDQAGTPELSISGLYNQQEQCYELLIEQSCPPTPDQSEKEPFHVPVAIALLDQNGNEMDLRMDDELTAVSGTRVLEVTDEKQCFRFNNIAEEPTPSLLRGFTAPVKVKYDYSDSDLMFLMAHDSDGFNRWDAAQALAQRVLLSLVKEPEYQVPDGFIAACRHALNGATLDKQLLAQVLALPTESYLGDQMEQVDVDGVHRAREQLKTALSEQLYDDWQNCYESSCDDGDYDLSTESIGRRALKNLALGYLIQTNQIHGIELCVAQYEGASNMTDRLAALSLMAHIDSPESTNLTADFYDRWKDDPLVLDKWFAVQALSKREDTLDKVKMLMNHPAFSIRNPNKVRALIGTFCAGNIHRFHDIGGEGYRFLVDQIIELDQLNPQIAARMLRVLSRWRRFDETRQRLMHSQIQRILDSGDVSKDLFEIASKSVG